jgi:hypothetical protein
MLIDGRQAATLYVYIYTYIHIYTYVYAYTHICIHAHIHEHMYTNMQPSDECCDAAWCAPESDVGARLESEAYALIR